MNRFNAALATLLVLTSFGPARSALAQGELAFSSVAAETCMAQTPAEDRLLCAGLAANECMARNEGGETTYGMASCLSQEVAYWDGLLNQSYKDLVAIEKAADDEMAKIGSSAAPHLPALKAMQRAWITYRDALCGYEYSQWDGGSGSGPASAACMLRETARQTLVLRGYLDRGY